ncbi:hypothetical protein [Microcoleus sp. B4-C1]|uniref:hypothetical protein n=1 Tax=Microcoleus sp. B4-C1 TaxID=2818660 RepID=UPI002FD4D94D
MPNIRKPQPNLSKPSEGNSFNAGRKPSESTNPLQGLNISAEQELGSVGGIKATGRLTVGVDNLIGQQGVNIEIDATNRTAGAGVEIGSTKGKLGVNIGGNVGYGQDGKISIRGAEAGINIGGFGGSASIDEDQGIRGSISVAGAKIEVSVSPEGKKSLSLCYGVPGGELCVGFEPDPGISTTTAPPEPFVTELPPKLKDYFEPKPPIYPPPISDPDFGNFGETPPLSLPPEASSGKICKIVVTMWSRTAYMGWFGDFVKVSGYSATARGRANVTYDKEGNLTGTVRYTVNRHDWLWYNPAFYTMPAEQLAQYNYNFVTNQEDTPRDVATFSPYFYYAGVGLRSRQLAQNVTEYWGDEALIYKIIRDNSRWQPGYPPTFNPNHSGWTTWTSSAGSITQFSIAAHWCGDTAPITKKIQLPNYPQHIKIMNCCDKVEEIYKYLGIAKLKKNKFPVSNAFLVPGGTGSDNYVDYYAITQALFRMLANGLIINPKSKPLGTEWQNVNATAWASSMYEMMAESMSDGNSSQRFEIAAIMQLVQIMSAVAENSRKTEFVIDALGFEPDLVSEDLPVCFTIHESHRGFGKKEKEKIKVSGLKTNEQVEAALGKMLTPSLVPIIKWQFKPGEVSISEALENGK